MMRKIKVGIVGFGTIGSGVIKSYKITAILLESALEQLLKL